MVTETNPCCEATIPGRLEMARYMMICIFFPIMAWSFSHSPLAGFMQFIEISGWRIYYPVVITAIALALGGEESFRTSSSLTKKEEGIGSFYGL